MFLLAYGRRFGPYWYHVEDRLIILTVYLDYVFKKQTNKQKRLISCYSEKDFVSCHKDLNLGETVGIFMLFYFPGSVLYLLNGFDF